jgi:hypothetical protein
LIQIMQWNFPRQENSGRPAEHRKQWRSSPRNQPAWSASIQDNVSHAGVARVSSDPRNGLLQGIRTLLDVNARLPTKTSSLRAIILTDKHENSATRKLLAGPSRNPLEVRAESVPKPTKHADQPSQGRCSGKSPKTQTERFAGDDIAGEEYDHGLFRCQKKLV